MPDFKVMFGLAFPKRKGLKKVCIFTTINLGRNGFTVSTADFSGGLAEGIRRGFFAIILSNHTQ
jgi:hypothetical protein